MKRVSFALVTVPFALAAAFLAGCGPADSGGEAGSPTAPAANGVADLEGKEILERAKQALGEAKSYRVKGDVVTDGQKISLDFATNGSDLSGTLAIDKASVELLLVGGEQFMRPDPAFWTETVGADAGENIAKLMGDKWAKVSAKDDMSDLFAIANIEELLTAEGTVAKGQTKQIDGVEAIGLNDGTADGTLWVATTGEPYPLLLEGPAGEGQLAFSDFGETIDIKAPPAAEVIDFDKLKNAA